MRIPPVEPLYREPLNSVPARKTYVFQVSSLCQLHWDYEVDWKDGEEPRLWIYGYRCFQREKTDAEFRIVDSLPSDIPVWDGMLRAICLDAAEELFASSRIVGRLVATATEFVSGIEEAARKRYDLRQYRVMMQGTQRRLQDR